MAYRHIVLFKIREDVSEEVFAQALAMLQALGKGHLGLVQWNVVQSLDSRKGRVIIEDSTFVDEAAFQNFRKSEAHEQAGVFMREIADWIVGDYEADADK